MAGRVARRIVVRGLVQGVWFRADTRARAVVLGLTGWIRNRDDGRVEAHVEGDLEAVDGLITWIREEGPPRARVIGVEVTDADVIGATHFDVAR